MSSLGRFWVALKARRERLGLVYCRYYRLIIAGNSKVHANGSITRLELLAEDQIKAEGRQYGCGRISGINQHSSGTDMLVEMDRNLFQMTVKNITEIEIMKLHASMFSFIKAYY